MSQTAEFSPSAQQPGRPLLPEERGRLVILALPTTALALAITVVSTYLGEITRRYTQHTALIGLIIGSEGIMAIWIPLIAGAWSDQLRTPIGGRLPFVLAGGVPAAGMLLLLGFLGSLGAVALAAAVFFALYFVAYEPYRAMYPDLVDAEAVAGRAQSTQALARGAGTGLALLGGGLLLTIARPLPFAVAGVVLLLAVTGFTVLVMRRGLMTEPDGEPESAWQVIRRLPRLVGRHPALRAYFFANALWETALSALKAFVILYLTVGLGYGLSTASLLVGGVAVVILLGAVAAGKAGDRFGRLRVLTYSLVAYGCGYLVLVFTTSRPLVATAVPFVAIGGGTVMTLAYAVLMPLMPKDEHGLLTGFYSLSRGIGIIAGPIIAGTLISVTADGPFAATHGFQAMWIVCAVASFASLPFLRRLRRETKDREALRAG